MSRVVKRMTVYRSWDIQQGARGPARHTTCQTHNGRRVTGGANRSRVYREGDVLANHLHTLEQLETMAARTTRATGDDPGSKHSSELAAG